MWTLKNILVGIGVIVVLGGLIAGGLYVKNINTQLKELKAKNEELISEKIASMIADQVNTHVGENTTIIAPDVKSAAKVMNNHVYLEKQGGK